MRLIDIKTDFELSDWINENYREIGRSIGFTEKEIVENDNLKPVLCLYYEDENGINSDDIAETIRKAVTNEFGFKYESKQSLPMAGSIRRELYFTV